MIRAFFIFPIPILQVLVNLLFSKNYCDLQTLIHILYHSPFHIILKAATRSQKRNEAITLLVVASFTISLDKDYLLSSSSFSILFTIGGLACPLVAFITCPTKKPSALPFPPL